MPSATFRKLAAVMAISSGALSFAPNAGSAMMNQNANAGGGGEPPVVAKENAPEPADDPEEPTVPIGEKKPAAPLGERIVDIAAQQAGDPYVWGAVGPDQFDCSGLVRYVHAKVGIELPRTSRQQRAAVPSISKSEMRPGDLLFFHEGGNVYHVGIFAGEGKMWAAPEPGDVVRMQDIWTESFTVGRAW